MPSFDSSWFEATDAHITKRLAAMGGSGPGVVVSYDSATETATVRPGVHRTLPDASNPDFDEIEEYPDVYSVPVLWPRGRGYSVVGSLSAGDPVMLVACARDISAWRRTGEAGAPDDTRLAPWAAVVAIPGLQGDAGTPARFEAPTDAAALASKLDTLIGILKGMGSSTDPDVLALKTSVTAYFTGVPSKPPVPVSGAAFVGTTTGSTILKVNS